MTADLDFDNEVPPGEEPEDEAESTPRRNPLRLILLIALIVIIVCCGGFLLVRTFAGNLVSNLPIPGIGAPQPEPPPAEEPVPAPTEPVAEEPAPLPEEETEPVASPAEEEGELVPVPEETEAVMPEEAPVPEEEAPPAEEEEVVVPDDVVETPTVAPVPGPTATSVPPLSPEAGPTVVITVDSCQANNPPTAQANGPNTAMMGKGQAMVSLDAAGSIDLDGSIVTYEWDFGDGSASESGQSVVHGYTSTGTYTVTLTVTDNCGATGQSTLAVTIVGPTPPASSN